MPIKRNISIKSVRFQPDHDYCRKAVKLYIQSGGAIRIVKSDYDAYMALGHTSQADNFLMEA